MHHRFVPHGNHLDNVRILLSKSHRTLNFFPVGFEVLHGVVGGTGPGALAIDPCPEHDVHLKRRVRLLQL